MRLEHRLLTVINFGVLDGFISAAISDLRVIFANVIFVDNVAIDLERNSKIRSVFSFTQRLNANEIVYYFSVCAEYMFKRFFIV